MPPVPTQPLGERLLRCHRSPSGGGEVQPAWIQPLGERLLRRRSPSPGSTSQGVVATDHRVYVNPANTDNTPKSDAAPDGPRTPPIHVLCKPPPAIQPPGTRPNEGNT